jgi:hydrogenase expression/formation protein HypE
MSGRKDYQRPLDWKRGRIDLNHGAGGRASAQLVGELFAAEFDNEYLHQGNDGAALPAPPELAAGGRLVMATDAHVVSPLFFPGGDLGCLAVHGTVNDVAMLGARPLWLAASFILEEGKGDGCFVSTTGVGVLPRGRDIGGARARPGDVLLLSGTVGEHGVAVLSQRESLAFETAIVSDTAALHDLVATMLAAAPEGSVHVLRDPTRGGLATTLNEIAQQSGVGIELDEAAIPVLPQVEAACELLGLDPLYLANEGKLVAAVAPDAAAAVLAAMQRHPHGAQAARIGVVHADPHRFVQMRTRLGGRRIVDWLSGEPLPRIC